MYKCHDGHKVEIYNIKTEKIGHVKKHHNSFKSVLNKTKDTVLRRVFVDIQRKTFYGKEHITSLNTFVIPK